MEEMTKLRFEYDYDGESLIIYGNSNGILKLAEQLKACEQEKAFQSESHEKICGDFKWIQGDIHLLGVCNINTLVKNEDNFLSKWLKNKVGRIFRS
jgi:hypothetical protein